jgi:hypothetical protein
MGSEASASFRGLKTKQLGLLRTIRSEAEHSIAILHDEKVNQKLESVTSTERGENVIRALDLPLASTAAEEVASRRSIHRLR